MRKKLEWIHGDKMLMESGHKTFDSQCQLVCTGNVVSACQISSYIRCWNDEGKCLIDYDTNKRSPGYLFNWDCDHFPDLPGWLRKRLEYFAQETDESMILYKFQHFNDNSKIIHGWVLTDSKYNLLADWVTGPGYKSWLVLHECKKYIVEDYGKDKEHDSAKSEPATAV